MLINERCTGYSNWGETAQIKTPSASIILKNSLWCYRYFLK